MIFNIVLIDYEFTQTSDNNAMAYDASEITLQNWKDDARKSLLSRETLAKRTAKRTCFDDEKNEARFSQELPEKQSQALDLKIRIRYRTYENSVQKKRYIN